MSPPEPTTRAISDGPIPVTLCLDCFTVLDYLGGVAIFCRHDFKRPKSISVEIWWVLALHNVSVTVNTLQAVALVVPVR
jgi:hypothetical protein